MSTCHEGIDLHTYGGTKYCALYYTKENFLKAYEFSITSLHNESTWNISRKLTDIIVLPPIWKPDQVDQRITIEAMVLWTTCLNTEIYVDDVER